MTTHTAGARHRHRRPQDLLSGRSGSPAGMDTCRRAHHARLEDDKVIIYDPDMKNISSHC